MSNNSPPPIALCRRYGLRGFPNRSGGPTFTGWYAIPGKDEQCARYSNGEIEVFDTADSAIAAAGEEMCAALNARAKPKNRRGYRKMGAAEFAIALKRLSISPAQFAIYYGSDLRRVLQWIDGETDIPHPVGLLLMIMAMPNLLTVVQQYTDMMLIEKIPEAAPIDV